MKEVNSATSTHDCSMCGTSHIEQSEFCSTCGYHVPINKGHKNMDEFVFRKLIEGSDAKIKLLEKKLEEYESIFGNISLMLQTLQIQQTAIVKLLIDKKGIINQEELKEALEEAYAQAEKVLQSRYANQESERENNGQQVQANS